MNYLLPLAIVIATTSGVACAADNSHIVILDRQQHSSPFGRYESRRRTEVFGPSSGFRYEEYRNARPGRAARGYPGYGGSGYPYGHGRVIQRFGPGVRAAPDAPRIRGYHDGFGNRFGNRFRRDEHRFDHEGRRSRRAIEPAQRAIQPHPRAIEPSGRVIGQ